MPRKAPSKIHPSPKINDPFFFSFFFLYIFIADNISDYVCMLVQRFEPQGRLYKFPLLLFKTQEAKCISDSQVSITESRQ